MDINSFIHDYHALTKQEVLKKYNLSRDQYYRLKKKYNLPNKLKTVHELLNESQKQLVIEMYQNGSSLDEIGREVNLMGATVKKFLLSQGINYKSPLKVQLHEIDKEAYIQDYYEGLSIVELCEKYGISEATYFKAVKDFNLIRRRLRLEEIATEDDYKKIVDLASQNHTATTISSETGFSTDMIMHYLDSNNIKRNHGHLTYYKGVRMRSTWEVIFAKHLDKLNLYWEYEPKKFDLGDRTYTPDFLVYENGKRIFYEIKGRVSDKDCRRSLLFMELFPEIEYYLVCEKEIKLLKKEVLSYGA